MDDHNLFCDCEDCDIIWDKLQKETEAEIEYGECEEYDDECEAELDSHFDRNGW